MRSTTTLWALAGMVALAAPAHAVTAKLTPRVTYFANTSFNAAPISGNEIAGYYAIDVILTVNGPFNDGDTGFSGVLFDFGFSDSALSPFQDGAWTAHNPTVDVNGSVPGGSQSLFLLSQDAGPSATDLKAILASVAGGTFSSSLDPRYWIGQDGAPQGITTTLANANAAFDASAEIPMASHPGFIIGSALIYYDGSAGSHTITFENMQFSLKNSNGTNNVRTIGTATGNIGLIVPEPTLAGILAGVVLFGRKRR